MSGNFDVNWTFTPEGAAGVPFKLGPSGQVRYFFFNNVETVHGPIESESTRGSVHIRQGLPCQTLSFEDILEASSSGRASSDSR